MHRSGEILYREDNAQPLRICSYNIHKGRSLGNRRLLLNNIRDAIRVSRADVLFLQEVVGEQRHPHLNTGAIIETQFEYLADSVWPHQAYGKNAVYDKGHHGNAILSRFPLSCVQNYDLSIMRYSSRGLLQASALDNVQLFCVHLGLFAFERRAQIKKMIDIILQQTDESKALIIAGDFNDWSGRGVPSLQRELQLQEASPALFGRSKATYPAFRPTLSMDRIFYRGLALSNAKVLRGAPWNRLSDHCAIYAEFQQ